MKIVLVVFLVSGMNSFMPLYYSEFSSLSECEIKRKEVHKDSGWYPLKKAYCVEFKK